MKKNLFFIVALLGLIAFYGCSSSDGVDPVPEPPTSLTYSPNSIEMDEGAVKSSSVPTVSGEKPITFSLVASPNSAISINASTGVISASAVLPVGDYILNVKAKNDDGEETFNSVFSIKVNIVVAVPSNLAYSPNSITVKEGEVGSSVTPTIGGRTPITFELVSSPSSEISVDGNTGVVSSTASLAIGDYPLNIKATNSDGNETFNNAFTITVVKADAQLPTNLAYSPNSIEFTQGNTGVSVTPTVGGKTPITFELIGSPSSEISINASTGVISATAALAKGDYSLNVKATNEDGSETFNNVFSIKVNEPKTAPSSLTYNSSNVKSRKHEAKSVTATADGTAPLTFEITNSGSLPSGISINSSTGKIDFAKGIGHGSYEITVKVSNSEGSKTFDSIVSFISEAVVFEGSIGVQSIISNKCSSCHTPGGTRRDYTNFNNAKSFASTIHSRVNSGSMPQGGAKLPQEEIDRIQQWINDGLKQD